jgi:predicted O-methyltransferase YrrM
MQFENYLEDERMREIEERMEWARSKYETASGRQGLSAIHSHGQRGYYAIVRALEADTVVETGVANGASTYALLAALEDQDNGQLISVDLPFTETTYGELDDEAEHLAFLREKIRIDRESATGETSIYLPDGFDPGWIVPESLRHRWDLRLGRSQRELPALFSDLHDIDLFIHDSDHTMPCQLFEYELAWEWLRPGGILLSDDIGAAFDVFVDTRPVDCSGRLTRSIGYIRKPDENNV